MKRNKKLLMYFLALNTIISTYISAAPTLTLNSDKMYNRIIKSIEKRRTNDGNYKTIEKILNQKNKELKDLYLQNDYVVKPEYLEWQVFFTGFYDEHGKGRDNTSENAEYHTKVDGYYDANGNYIVTGGRKGGVSGKPYKSPQIPKDVNLGVSIPLKGMTREPLNLALSPMEEISINPNTLNIAPPAVTITPVINTYKFDIAPPKIDTPTITVPASFTVSVPNTGNGDDTGSYLGTTGQYTAKIGQYNLTSGLLEGTWNTNSSLSSYKAEHLYGTSDAGGNTMGSRLPLVDFSYNSSTGDGAVALYKLGGAENITLGTPDTSEALIMRITSKLAATYNTTLPHLIQYDPHGNRGTYTPYTTDYFGNPLSSWGVYDKYAELLNYARLEGIGNSLLIIGLQGHGGSFSPTVKNHGTIIGLYDEAYANGGGKQVAFTFMAGTSTAGRRFEFYNTENGKIEMQAKQSIAFNYGSLNTAKSYYSIYNDGDVVLYGNNSVGIKTGGATGIATGSKVILNTPIRINGDQSMGVELARTMDDGFGNITPGSYDTQAAVIKVIIGDEINQYAGNGVSSDGVTSLDENFVEQSIGLFVNNTDLDYRLGFYDFKFGDYAKNSTLINVTNGKLMLDNNSVTDMEITKGRDNFGIIITGANSELTLNPNIKIGTAGTSVNGTTAIYGEKGGKIHLNTANNIETHGTGSHAIILSGSGTVLDDSASGLTHNFTATGDNSAVIYAIDSAAVDLSNSSKVDIKATGDRSIGVYSKEGTIRLGSGSGTGDYEIGTNGVLFYNDGSGAGRIETSGVNFTVGNGSLFARFETPSTTAGNEQIKFTHTAGNTNLNLLSGGIGFVYTGDGITPVTSNSIKDYLNNNFSGLANMNVTVNAGARLYVIEKYASINLTSVNAISSPSNIFNDVNNLGGSKAFLVRGTLVLDPVTDLIDLDNVNEDYNRIERALTGIIVNPGVTINGTYADQNALADDNSYDATTYVKMTNNGTINLTGASSIGIYTNNGQINNNSVINSTGENSVGIFSENGTVTSNSSSGIITIGNKGVGIYGVSYQDSSNPGSFGGGLINITNNGIIKANAGTNAIGIYANNNGTGGAGASNIHLTSGTIDVSASENGVGLYVNNSMADSNGSIITVGKNGIGLYAKNSNLSLTDTTINLNGDNALGMYLDGNTSLVTPGTNTININGQNTVLFNIVSGSSSISNNFTVGTVNPGSSYTIGNISQSVFSYSGNSILESNGLLVSGKNSIVYLNSSIITANSGATGIAAVALDGQYSGSDPLPAGMTSNTDGENNGTIVLGDNSVGLYGKNNSRLNNKNIITAGNSSAGIMTSGAGASAINTGIITVGAGSQGIYLKDGTDVQNKGFGQILSSGIGTIGIYADNVSSPIVNGGTIQLLGDKSIGIYTKGLSIKTINNNGTIETGNSSDVNNPSIGIYSDNSGDIITNNGTIKSGINSIGIYSNNGIVNQNGVLEAGSNGVGIYATNSDIYLNFGSGFDMGTNGAVGAVGVYGIGASVTNSADLNIGNNNYGFIMKNGSFTSNTGTNNTVGSDSVFLYSTEATTVTNDGNLTMTGSDNVGYYTAQDPVSGTSGASVTNTGSIIGTAGNNNVGIYNYGGRIDNTGTVSVGGSDLLFEKNSAGVLEVDVENSKYAVGIYGENSTIVNHSGAVVSAGYGGFGIVAKGGTATNYGEVITSGDYSTGMYTEGGIITNESGATIDVTGNNAIGMAGKGEGSHLINNGTINITGDNAIGMYGNLGTIITNTGTINITGSGQAFVSSDPGDSAHNIGAGATVNGILDNSIQSIGSAHTLPVLINAGIIKTNGVLALEGLQVLIKPDPTSVKPSPDPDYDFELSGTSITADQITTSKPIVILPGFADGTIANVYKLEGVINAASGKYDFVSGSLLWEATPKATGTGSDVYMSRKAFTEFSDGLWFDEFGKAMENNYLSAAGDGIEIYNKTGYIKTEEEFRHIMGSLAGNIYANINQRENDISRTFENSLDIIENSENNTKENVKITVIGGKGKNKEETDGITGYDYTTTGVLALREIERTYRHKFGYSLGYLHTGFEFKDGNESEEWVDTIQLGIHNKYNVNNWILKNDLMGRVSIHNIDRNIDWPSPLKRSEMNGTYETYSITSDNRLGKVFELGKKSSVMPYAGLRAMYVMRPTFSESGLEALKVEGNDAWSVKPRAGVELQTALPLAGTYWQFKGTLDFAYEYELADLNEREKAKLAAVEDGYHRLSKPEDEKGTFRTKASIGVEIKDSYGIFLTGEYLTGEDKEDDYRAGVVLKAVF